jgi:hypothetical protein
MLKKYQAEPNDANYDLLAPHAHLVLPELAKLTGSREFLTKISRYHVEQSEYGSPWGKISPSETPLFRHMRDPLSMLISTGSESVPYLIEMLSAEESPDMAARLFYALYEIGHYGPGETEVIYQRLMFHGRSSEFDGRQMSLDSIYWGFRCLQNASSSRFEQACSELLSSGNTDAKHIVQKVFEK